jgi:hypothetical protein
MEEISYQSLWDVPIDTGATDLISTGREQLE